MRVLISTLLLILVVHFFLQGVTFHKTIDLRIKEMFVPSEVYYGDQRYVEAPLPGSCLSNEKKPARVVQTLVDKVQCDVPPVQPANLFVSNENDANFQSNVMNLNRFYRKNDNEAPKPAEVASSGPILNQGKDDSLNPNTWRYENELPMNGGAILPGLSGYDDLTDLYGRFDHDNAVPNPGCDPSTRGALKRDDLRMGMGVIGATEREER